MITEAILTALSTVGAFVIGLFPSIPLPSFITTVGDYISSGLTSAAGFSNLLPIGPLRLSVVFLLGCLSAAFSVRLFRIAVSAFIGGGL